jgi:hypothetical protein
MAGAGIKVCSDYRHIQGDLPGGMRAVDQRENALLARSPA